MLCYEGIPRFYEQFSASLQTGFFIIEMAIAMKKIWFYETYIYNAYDEKYCL